MTSAEKPREGTPEDTASSAETAFILECMAIEESRLWREHRSPKEATFGALLQRLGICKATAYEVRAKALREGRDS